MEEYLVLTAKGMIQKQNHVLAVREVLGLDILVFFYDLVENKETTQNVRLKWPAMDAYRVELALNVLSQERCCYKCGKNGATTTTEGHWVGTTKKCLCADIREF